MALKDFAQQGPQPANANSCLTGDHKKQALEHAYKQVMERIVEQEPDTRKLAIGALSWLIHAFEPLSKEELQHALGAGLAIDHGEPKLDEDILPDIEEVISTCAGMVTVDESTGEVRLIHYTTFDYLWDTQEQWFPRMDALQRIVRTCLFYMSQYYNPDEGALAPSFQSTYPFGWHAQYNWGMYARHLPICEEVIDFLLDDERVEFHDPFEHRPDHTGLQFACSWGIHYAIPRLLEHNPHAYLMKDGAGRTPLMLAVGGPRGVRSDDRTERARTLRILHETTVRLLYEGSTIDYPITQSHTAEALKYAVGNENMFKLLVRLGDLDLNFRGKSGRSPLSFAVGLGDDIIVKLLLDSGQVEVDLQDDMGRTPLSYAPQSYTSPLQGKRIVEMLLNAGADANLKDNGGRVPLIHAAGGPDTYGVEDGLIPLLAATKEGELNSKDPGGHTVLSHAVAKGFGILVQLLVDREIVNPNTTDELGRSPLFYGAMGKIEDEDEPTGVVDTLLQRNGIDVNQRDFTGSTPLSAAARLGNIRMVSLLLNRPDIALDDEDIFGRTALSWAVAEGQGGIIKLLLDKYAEQGQNITESDLQIDTDTNTDRKPDTLTPTNSLLCFVCLVARVDVGNVLWCKQCRATTNWRKSYLVRHPCKRCFDMGIGCRSGGPHKEPTP
jgi:ankyrin repeat protein